MRFSDWLNLSDDERDKMCQQLNPYEDWDLFKTVETEFISKFGNQSGVGNVFCGSGAGLGAYNAITVEILPSSPRTKLPKSFLGFPVVKTQNRK
jgi:hypothetical protein